MKKLFCMMDTETTGLEEYHEIIETGMILFDKDFNVYDDLRILVNAEHSPETFSAEAMKINGFDPTRIAKHGIDRDRAALYIKEFLANNIYELKPEKIVPVGHNILRFDIPKMEKFIFTSEKFDYFFSTRDAIDTKTVANFFNIDERFSSTSLHKLAELFGIDTTGAHSALDDCRINLEVLKKFKTMIKGGV